MSAFIKQLKHSKANNGIGRTIDKSVQSSTKNKTDWRELTRVHQPKLKFERTNYLRLWLSYAYLEQELTFL